MAQHIRKDIDGLKGIAIITVVLYHFFELLNTFESSDIKIFSSGFLGVDIFLAVSGYLITASVMSRMDSGSFSLKAFYHRRLLRILPPMLVMCLFTLVAGYFFLQGDVYSELCKENIFALTFIGNYRFPLSGGYFALDSSEKLLLHTWYLCITIQFYLICPVLLSVLSKLFSREKLNISLSVTTLLLILISYAFSLGGNGYLLTHTRIWEMFLGGAVYLNREGIKAFLCQKCKLKTAFIEIAGIALVIIPFFTVSLENGAWHLSTSALTVAGTVIVLIAANEKSFLSVGILNHIGKISYSLYLWHWPLIILVFDTGYSGETAYCMLTAVSVYAVALVSYNLTEKKKISDMATAGIYLSVIALAIIGLCNHGRNYLSAFERESARTMVADDTLTDTSRTPYVYKTIDSVPVYRLGSHDSDVHTFVIGDSHAEHYAYYLRNICTEPMLFAFMHGTIGYGSNFTNYKVTVVSTQEERQTFNRIYTGILSELHSGDRVVIASRWDVYYRYYQREFALPDNEQTYRGFVKALCNDLKEQIDRHPELLFYVVGQGINTSKQVVNCLKTDLEDSILAFAFNKDRCAFTKDYLPEYRHNLINSSLESLCDSYRNVTFIDRNIPQSAAGGLYRTYTQSGEPIYFDKTHYTSAGGSMIGKYIFDIVFDRNNN
ncbi:MAG: acyltransferase family protein [Succinivibrio sp.]